MKELKRLLPYLMKYRWGILIGLFFVLTSNLLSAMVPWLVGRIVDVVRLSIGHPSGMSIVAPLIWYFLLVVLMEGVLRFYMRRVLIGISRTIEYDLRNDFFAHIQTLSQSIYGKIRTGEFMSRATNDLGNVRMVLGPGIMYSFTTVTVLLFVLTVMFGINVKLTLIGLIPLPILTVGILLTSRVLHKRYTAVQKNLAELTTVVQENISGIRVVKGHCREQGEIDRFMKKNDEMRDANLGAARIYSGFFPFMMAIAGISTVTVLYFGGQMVGNGVISLGDLVAFFAYLGLLIWPMMSLGWVISLFQRGSASMKRINEILDTHSEIINVPDAVKPDEITGEVEFRNVSFRYSEDTPAVLHDISFNVEAGKTIAIVGPTGSGKSTLLRLITRLYDPSDGAVLIDGIDSRELDMSALRGATGYVPQETFLFSETIKENISFGAHGEDVPDDKIEQVAGISRLSNDIQAFPNGYDTMLGERGINMSGGQKQRTAIARALAGDPRILLLDDCLSAVDTNTEAEILQGLKRELEGRTAFVVSHRMSSIKDSDEILVLRDGRIAERGSHDTLLNLGGMYADLWHKQQLSRELALE